jgi:hypothetical protein
VRDHVPETLNSEHDPASPAGKRATDDGRLAGRGAGGGAAGGADTGAVEKVFVNTFELSGRKRLGEGLGVTFGLGFANEAACAMEGHDMDVGLCRALQAALIVPSEARHDQEDGEGTLNHTAPYEEEQGCKSAHDKQASEEFLL